eukprot:TRINITY_DN60356_c0_g1_i1.p1 TRINITY_DN60356_c0_g1~~TRINITY_DN60356_c0_g1_i1.p1  ORF type:complete len:610 (+),score=185.94 TRINITY_DN60356_c0_g1_i1:87-1832(+)
MATITTEKVAVDPRSGLDIIRVTDKHFHKKSTKFGSYLDNRVIHWVGHVKKVNRHWNEDKRIAVLSDECLYLCLGGDGNITRCVPYVTIREVIETGRDPQDPNAELRIAFVITQSGGLDGQYDLLLRCKSLQQKADILRILDICYQRLKGEKLPRRPLDDNSGELLAETLTLKKPRDWQNEVREVTRIPKLLEANPPAAAEAEQATPSRTPTEGTPAVQDREENRRVVHQEFERIRAGLWKGLEDFRQDELSEMQREAAMYAGMLEERDAEIETLREQISTLTANPEFWRNCKRCRAHEQEAEVYPSPAAARKRELERKILDYEHLIQHLQLTRSGRSGFAGMNESAELARQRDKLDAMQTKVRELQRLIVENPYPTEDVRIQAERIAQGDEVGAAETPHLRALQERADRLDRELVGKDRTLRQQRGLMRDAFRRQVQELHRVRAQFQDYDRQIVNYLEKVFSANAFPQGPAAYGQTPRQLAEATSQAARQAATPAAFPQHTVGVNMPLQSGIEHFNARTTSRRAASPIGQFVAPNVVSEPSQAPDYGADGAGDGLRLPAGSASPDPVDRIVWQQHRRRNL